MKKYVQDFEGFLNEGMLDNLSPTKISGSISKSIKNLFSSDVKEPLVAKLENVIKRRLEIYPNPISTAEREKLKSILDVIELTKTFPNAEEVLKIIDISDNYEDHRYNKYKDRMGKLKNM